MRSSGGWGSFFLRQKGGKTLHCRCFGFLIVCTGYLISHFHLTGHFPLRIFKLRSHRQASTSQGIGPRPGEEAIWLLFYLPTAMAAVWVCAFRSGARNSFLLTYRFLHVIIQTAGASCLLVLPFWHSLVRLAPVFFLTLLLFLIHFYRTSFHPAARRKVICCIYRLNVRPFPCKQPLPSDATPSPPPAGSPSAGGFCH